MDNQRWGFEEAEDWEYQELGGQTASKANPEPAETLVGRDPDGAVEVVVSPAAEVLAVRLSPKWRSSVDPRGLHSCVVTAANMATMQALAHGVEQVDFIAAANAPQAAPVGADESALTAQDMQRLFDSVTTELESFTERASAVIDRPTTVRSAGGHVQGTAHYGQVLSVDIEASWVVAVRQGEIESELFEVLRALRESNTPDDLVAGPAGTGISELMELVSDPRRLMRRLGLPG